MLSLSAGAFGGAGLWAPLGELCLVPWPFTLKWWERLIPFLEPLMETVRETAFSTVAMQICLDHSESIVSLIFAGSSFGFLVARDGLVDERMGMLNTRPGDVGGLEGGDATEVA